MARNKEDIKITAVIDGVEVAALGGVKGTKKYAEERAKIYWPQAKYLGVTTKLMCMGVNLAKNESMHVFG